jgi:hypothetical protein
MCGIIIFLINRIVLQRISILLSHYEERDCKSQEEISQSKKYFIGIFLNTAIITILTEVIFLDNMYDFGGFIDAQTSVFVTDLVLFVIFEIINPDNLWKAFQRSCIPSLIPWRGPSYLKYNALTQEEANNLFEPHEFKLGR